MKQQKGEKNMYNPGQELSTIDFGSIIGGSLNAIVKAQSESAHTTVDFVKSVGFKPGAVDANTGREVGVGEPICVSFSYDKEVSPSTTQTTRNVTIDVTGCKVQFDKDKPIQFSIVDGGNKHEIEGVECKLDDDGKISNVTLKKIPTEEYVVDGADVEVSQEGKTETETLKLKVEEKREVLPALYQKMNIEVPILTMMPIPFIKIDHADIDFNVKINSVSSTSSNSSSNTNVSNKTNAGARGFFGIYSASTSLSASFSNQKSSSSSEEVKKDYSLNISIHAVQDDMPAGMSRILDILEESIVTKAVSEPKKKA